MKSILPILTVAALGVAGWIAIEEKQPFAGAGQGSATTVPTLVNVNPEQAAQAAALMRRVVEAIEAHQSIIAKVRQQTELFGHRLVGSGTYIQQGRAGERLARLGLKMPVVDQLSSFEQICDGNYLWTRQEVGSKLTLSRVDLVRVREALRDRAGQGGPESLALNGSWLALGGLPKLLHSLERSFQFTSVTENRLDSLPVWTLHGQWRIERLAELFPEQKEKILRGQPVSLGKHADHFPDRVLLVVGQDDLFPYRLEYWQRKQTDDKNGPADVYRIPVLMELFEVQLDAPLDARGFAYKPGELELKNLKDQTDEFLKSVGLDEMPPVAQPDTSGRPQLR